MGILAQVEEQFSLLKMVLCSKQCRHPLPALTTAQVPLRPSL